MELYQKTVDGFAIPEGVRVFTRRYFTQLRGSRRATHYWQDAVDLLLVLDQLPVQPHQRREEGEALGSWLEAALTGAPTTVLTVVCPDYSYKEIGDGQYEFTFRELGSGIGLVAKRAQAAIPVLWQFFQSKRINARFVVALADPEATAGTCERLQVSQEEFIRRARCSQEALALALPPGIPVSTPLLTDLSLAYGTDWSALVEKASAAASLGRLTGVLPFSRRELEATARQRAPLYVRWHGAGVDTLECLRNQVADYMAVGLLSDSLQNCLVIGLDAPAMAPFVQGLGNRVRPVVYLRRIY